jgi:hypothetical protein
MSNAIPMGRLAARQARADVAGNIIFVGADHAEIPEPIMSHEMGHIASYLSKPFSNCGAGNYPTACIGVGTPGSCGGSWSIDAGEWKCLGFEEGLATFIGDVSYYWSWATGPRYAQSLSASICTGQLEASSGTGCSSEAGHH